MSMETRSNYDDFSVTELTHLIAHLKNPSPTIYWIDYLSSSTLGALCLFFSIHTDDFLASAAMLLVSIFSFYRALGFIHEIVHQKNQQFMRFFVPVWNIFTGSLFFLPSPYYLCHLKHHSSGDYGTVRDPQYPNFVENRPPPMVFFIFISVVPPVFFCIRSLIIAPASILVAKLRPFVIKYLSSFAEPGYAADYRSDEKNQILTYEMLHFLIWLGIGFSIYSGIVGIEWLKTWLVILFGVYALNGFRILGEHKYDYGFSGTRLTRDEMFFDSYNYTSIFNELIYTTGLRYHALHHLMPSIPYHNLPKAHKIIQKKFGSDSPYGTVNTKSHVKNVAKLVFRKARAT